MDNQYAKKLADARVLWDKEAPSFDQEADHSLLKPDVRHAWKILLDDILIAKANATALDTGCGTGSISMLLSELGYSVTGIDLSPMMIDIAIDKAKKHNQVIQFNVMDASFPTLKSQPFDLILCRHLLWALPHPDEVIQRWLKHLKSGGQLILIEGFWETGSGLHAKDILKILPSTMTDISVYNLSGNKNLWDKEVSDERYLITAIHKKA